MAAVGQRTPAWWWTRIELGVGVGLTVLAAAALWIAPPWLPMIGDGEPLELRLLPYVVAALGFVVGLVWMIRIMRGPKDEPPPWRYRDLP